MLTKPPAIILSKCVVGLKNIPSEQQYNKEELANLLGFSSLEKNGTAAATISSIQKYGLLEKSHTSPLLHFTPLGKKCINPTLDLTSLVIAAFTPPLFKNLFFQGVITHPEAVTEKLINKGFSPFTRYTAANAANCYCKNIEELSFVISQNTKTHPKEFISGILSNSELKSHPAPPVQFSAE